MKRTLFVLLAGIVLLGLTASQLIAQNANAQEPSLGSYARAAKKEKKPPVPTKKWDNDNLPRGNRISVVGNAPPATVADASAKPDADPQADADKGDKAEKGDKTDKQAAPSKDQQQAANEEWQGRISKQQEQVDMLARELHVNQREYQVRAAAFYADAGDRLRNQAAWDKEDAEYKQKLADKQKALDDARQQMTDMQEDARKAGVPSSALEAGQKPQQ